MVTWKACELSGLDGLTLFAVSAYNKTKFELYDFESFIIQCAYLYARLEVLALICLFPLGPRIQLKSSY